MASRAWLAEIKAACPNCVIKRNKVITPEGFWFKITMDQTVLEVLTEPMTFDQLAQRSEILEELIWKTGKKAYVAPHKRLGGGHLHLDIESHFGNDRMLFRNFIVDLVNRPELFMGGLGLNYFNAPPLSFYSAKENKVFKKIIAEFDKTPDMSIVGLMERMNSFYESLQHPVMPTPNSKFQAVNFKHFEMGTLEIRAVKPQVSAEHALRLVRMFESRIEVLKKTKKLIKVKVPDHSSFYQAERIKGFRIYTHALDASQIMASVQDYARAGGLEENFYQDFVTEELKADLRIEAESKKASGIKSAGSCGSFL
jgi:hypothetical protein